MNFNEFNIKNYLFIGEAGSGKSEIAINFAILLSSKKEKEVHFFDLDMTKPLFRSRDAAKVLEDKGIIVHFNEQFMDAPTTSGWLNRLLKEDVYVVMDVGGDYIGARSIGGYAPSIKKENTSVFYVINPFRPWSLDLGKINLVMGQVLSVSHLDIDKIKLIANPNFGLSTCIEDVVEGFMALKKMVEPYKEIDFLCVSKDLSIKQELLGGVSIFPIDLFLIYEWNEN